MEDCFNLSGFYETEIFRRKERSFGTMKSGDIIFGAIVIALFFGGFGYMFGNSEGLDEGFDVGYEFASKNIEYVSEEEIRDIFNISINTVLSPMDIHDMIILCGNDANEVTNDGN